MGKILLIAMIALAALLALGPWYERANPCLDHGPRELVYMQRVGDIVIPVYGRSCLRRAE